MSGLFQSKTMPMALAVGYGATAVGGVCFVILVLQVTLARCHHRYFKMTDAEILAMKERKKIEREAKKAAKAEDQERKKIAKATEQKEPEKGDDADDV